MNKRIAALSVMVVGVFISLCGIWVGSYFMSTLENGHWAEFPTFITAVLVFMFGICMATIASFNLE